VTQAGESLAGSVRWAVVPYVPQPPFRIYAGPEQPPFEIRTADQLVGAAREGGDPELTYLVSGKVRPVLVLADPPDRHHREVAALRLLRLSTLAPDERDAVRRGADELLVHLDPARFDLPEESAVMVTALVRLHLEAIATGPSAGRLEPQERRRIGELVVRFYGIDVGDLVEQRIRELAARRRGG
jgi:hypothetical protein